MAFSLLAQYRKDYMPFVVTLIVIFTLLLAAPADAHRSDTSRIHNMRHIAQTVWGDVCDVGTMNVPIVGKWAVLRDANGEPRPEWIALFSGIRQGAGYRDCRIEIDKRRKWTTEKLCRTMVHEFGHAAGRRHSSNPRSIMYQGLPGYYRRCANGAANVAK